ncbi:MAG: hypothetical protein ACRDBL_08015 [Rhabdaerophilum sp.]
MLDKLDLLIIGLDRLGLDLAMGAAALGASVVVTMQGETALDFARRDGEILSRLASTPFSGAAEFHRRYDELARWISVTRSPERLRAARVSVEPDLARFLSARQVAIGERVLTPRRIVIANGQISDEMPRLGVEAMPKRVLVSGHSSSSIALASIAMRAEAKTSLIFGAASLGRFDPEMSAIFLEALERQGLSLLSELPALRPAEVPIWHGTDMRPMLENLDLDKAGIKLRDGKLVLSSYLATSQSRISAIGSVTGEADAGMVGYLLARLMFRKPGRYAPPQAIRILPGMPGLAEIGLTEREARKRWGRIAIHRANVSELGPVAGTFGAVKLICSAKGNLVGASLLAVDSVALATPLALAIENNLGLEAISRLALPQGASAEALRLAASAPQRARLRSPRLQSALRFMRRFG